MICYHRSGDEFSNEERFCTGQAHILIETHTVFEDDIPEGANALKYTDGSKTTWSVGPCDGSCQAKDKLPDRVVKALIGFQSDGQPREETFKGYFDRRSGQALLG